MLHVAQTGSRPGTVAEAHHRQPGQRDETGDIMCILCDNFTVNENGICNECETKAKKKAQEYHRKHADQYAQYDESQPKRQNIRQQQVDHSGGRNG